MCLKEKPFLESKVNWHCGVFLIVTMDWNVNYVRLYNVAVFIPLAHSTVNSDLRLTCMHSNLKLSQN